MAIEAVNLSKSFGKRSILRDISFSVQPGELLGLAGLNGAGKTTIIRMLAGVLQPEHGSILIDGSNIATDKANASKRIGWVQENPVFFPESTVEGTITYFARLRGIDRASATAEIQGALDVAGISGIKKAKIRNLSMGLRKRLSIAISTLGHPKNYLFDEIFNGIDPEGIKFLKERINGLKKEGCSILLSSHVLSEMQSFADRVMILHQGSIADIVSTSDLAMKGLYNIKITVENPDNKLMDFLDKFGEIDVSGKTIRIKRATGDVGTINPFLVKNGYSVMELTMTENLLEDYFNDKTRNVK